eukprot:2622836-Alexandrium_andersonii.AAC.1
MRVEEFESISIDATLRVCFSIQGKASYRASRQERNQAAFGDADSFRRVLTIRGRAGAVLGLCPVAGEGVDDVCAALVRALPEGARGQVRFAACDNASASLVSGLQGVLPGLEMLALDPVHLAIVYEYSTWRKKTPGSIMPRRIMAKLTAIDPAKNGQAWGDAFNGRCCAEPRRREQTFREQVLDRSMPIAHA